MIENGITEALWSEHCSYKSSRIHLKKLPSTGSDVLVGPGENAGAIDIGDGLAVVFKVESHNHPSYIEPFQGAATGMGGILRDIFTMGARPFAAMNLLRFGALDFPKTPFLKDGVIGGISHYGNCFGIPTVVSDVQFDAAYNRNILVNAFAIGIVAHTQIRFAQAKGVGNLVVYVGAKTGRDGIHGANMASDVFSDDTLSKRPTVQVGDPFCEKLLLDACMACFEKNLVVGVQDLGAAGLTCASFEMAARSGTGLILNLDQVPVREKNMTPYEIMLSESQERMLFVVSPEHVQDVLAICKRLELDAAALGQVTDDGNVRLRWHGEECVCLNASAVVDGAPKLNRPYHLFPKQAQVKLPCAPPKPQGDLISTYDAHIGLNTLCSHDDAACALVQVPGSHKAVSLSIDCQGRWCEIDPREGIRRSLFHCVLQAACVGATPIGISDCLNYGSPESLTGMGQLVAGIEGLAEAAMALGIPVVSGNVSLYNETNGTPILPSPTIALVGLNPEPEHRALGYFVNDKMPIYYIAYADWSAENVRHLADTIKRFVHQDKVQSALPVMKGGLLATLERMGQKGGIGFMLIEPNKCIDAGEMGVVVICAEPIPGLPCCLVGYTGARSHG